MIDTNLGSFLLELLDGPLVDSSALVDQVPGGGGLAGVDMADDHDVDVDLFFSHCCLLPMKDTGRIYGDFEIKCVMI